MSKPITMSMTHHVGQEEAVKRIKAGVEAVKSKPLPVSIEATDWQGNTLNFRIGALGMRCHGTVIVNETDLKLDVHVPLALSFIIDKYLSIVRTKTQVLLGSK